MRRQFTYVRVCSDVCALGVLGRGICYWICEPASLRCSAAGFVTNQVFASSIFGFAVIVSGMCVDYQRYSVLAQISRDVASVDSTADENGAEEATSRGCCAPTHRWKWTAAYIFLTNVTWWPLFTVCPLFLNFHQPVGAALLAWSNYISFPLEMAYLLFFTLLASWQLVQIQRSTICSVNLKARLTGIGRRAVAHTVTVLALLTIDMLKNYTHLPLGYPKTIGRSVALHVLLNWNQWNCDVCRSADERHSVALLPVSSPQEGAH